MTKNHQKWPFLPKWSPQKVNWGQVKINFAPSYFDRGLIMHKCKYKKKVRLDRRKSPKKHPNVHINFCPTNNRPKFYNNVLQL